MSPAATKPKKICKRSSNSCASRNGMNRSAEFPRRALVGPPGTGKTLLARAVGEAKVPFLPSAAATTSMFVGAAARARPVQSSQTPCSSHHLHRRNGRDRPPARRALQRVNDEREQTLNQLLVEMDGFEANVGVILLPRPTSPTLDALLRPGRSIGKSSWTPDASGRLAVLKSTPATRARR